MKKVLAVILVICMVFALCACGSKEEGGEKKVVQQYTMGTMGATGGYMMLGTAIASIVNEKLPEDVYITPVQESLGSVGNIKAIESGERELGIASSNVCLDAANARTEDFPEKATEVMAWFTAHYGITYSIATKASGIKTWKDFEGKKVSIGSFGSNDAYLALNVFLPAAGVDVSKVKIEYLGMGDSTTAMSDGQIDAYIGTGAPKVASILSLTESRDTVFVPMDQAAIDKCLADYPEFIIKDMKQSDMPSMIMDAESYPTVAMKHVVIIDKDIDEDLVYNMTKYVFENLDKVQSVKAEFAVITLEEAAKGTGIAIHPGAAKYFKEKGVL
ncbi:MAG: TAXI family TRAP transporter solute-binding subunit [Clostridia bacterium]|nr:TAXI family TRAP transporter solute-binding subunit [Clostridia bacterium]